MQIVVTETRDVPNGQQQETVPHMTFGWKSTAQRVVTHAIIWRMIKVRLVLSKLYFLILIFKFNNNIVYVLLKLLTSIRGWKVKAILRDVMGEEKFHFSLFSTIQLCIKWPLLSPYYKPSMYSCWVLCVIWNIVHSMSSHSIPHCN